MLSWIRRILSRHQSADFIHASEENHDAAQGIFRIYGDPRPFLPALKDAKNRVDADALRNNGVPVAESVEAYNKLLSALVPHLFAATFPTPLGDEYEISEKLISKDYLEVTAHPDETWMAQVARNLTMTDTGFLHRMNATHVIMDRDTKFTEQFRHIISPSPASPFKTLRLPPRSPQANGYMERWFRTVKTNLIRKAYWLDAEALWQALTLYLEHYHTERPHQSLGNDPPTPVKRSTVVGDRWTLVRHPRVGGLINTYRKEEAA